jgi:hypothetical protein
LSIFVVVWQVRPRCRMLWVLEVPINIRPYFRIRVFTDLTCAVCYEMWVLFSNPRRQNVVLLSFQTFFINNSFHKSKHMLFLLSANVPLSLAITQTYNYFM